MPNLFSAHLVHIFWGMRCRKPLGKSSASSFPEANANNIPVENKQAALNRSFTNANKGENGYGEWLEVRERCCCLYPLHRISIPRNCHPQISDTTSNGLLLQVLFKPVFNCRRYKYLHFQNQQECAEIMQN